LFITATILAIAIILILVLYVCATFSYTLSPRSLILRWHILGRVPFGSRTIAFDDIEDARIFRAAPDLLGGYIFGNIPSKRIVTLVLRKRIFLMKRVLITPDEPDAFLAELRRQIPHIKADDGGGHVEARGHPRIQ
jgi:hypothetical protein